MADRLALFTDQLQDPAELARRFWSEMVSVGMSVPPGRENQWSRTVEEISLQLASFLEAGDFSFLSPDSSAGPPEILGGALAERFGNDHGMAELLASLELLHLCTDSLVDQFLADGQGTIKRAVAHYFNRLERAAASYRLTRETGVLRRRLREANLYLLREKRRYHTVFNQIHEPALIIDEHLAIVDANRAFVKAFGGSRESLLGLYCCQVLGESICSQCDLTRLFSQHHSFIDQEAVVIVNGQRRDVLIAGTFLGDINDQQGGGIVILQDITEKKEYQRQLAASEEKYRTLIENVPNVIWRGDALGAITYMSPNLVGLTGYGPEEFLEGGRGAWFARIWPEDADQVVEQYAALFADNRPIDLCYRFQKKDGCWIWLQDRSGRVYEADGVRQADGVLADITRLKLVEQDLEQHHMRLAELVDQQTRELLNTNERLRLEIRERQNREGELRRLADRLQQTNAELEQFAHVVSHDLKEPLLLVEAFAGKLEKKYGSVLDDRGRKYLEKINRAVRRMQTLIDGLLQLARITTAANPARAVELASLLEDVILHLEPRLAATGGRITVHSPHTLHGDPLQIWQLFINILANAIKYHRPGVAPRIDVRSQTTTDDFCEIVVKDNGMGFQEQDAERIFRPFERLSGHNHLSPGSGIGLATCKKIVLRHGGQIAARSMPGSGSTFIIRLPIWRS